MIEECDVYEYVDLLSSSLTDRYVWVRSSNLKCGITNGLKKIGYEENNDLIDCTTSVL